MKTNSAFTLIEILIVITIIGLLTAITVDYLKDVKQNKTILGIAESIAADLDESKANSQAGKNNIQHGIKFASSTYTIFEGTSFSESNESNIEKQIDSSYSISTNLNNDLIYFSKINGEPSNDGIVKVTSVYDENVYLDIIIGQLGDVTVIK